MKLSIIGVGCGNLRMHMRLSEGLTPGAGLLNGISFLVQISYGVWKPANARQREVKLSVWNFWPSYGVVWRLDMGSVSPLAARRT